MPPPIPAAAKRRQTPDDGSVDIDIDLTPSFELVAPPTRTIARGTVPPAHWPSPIVLASSDDDDPTPLPPPYVETDDDAWLDAKNFVDAARADAARAEARIAEPQSIIRRRLGTFPIVRLGIAAILTGGLSAMAVMSLRDSPAVPSTPAVTPAHAATSAPSPQPTITPIETSTVAVQPQHAAPPPPPSPPRSPTPRTTRVAAAPSATGTLMVSSKPPCEIAIDGVATTLTTPQRSIKLRPGKHTVTLLNAEHEIDATFEVVVEANKPTKLIRDFMGE
jgi:hypothetical protein